MERVMTIPTFLPYFVFAGTAATVIAILYGLHRALVRANWPEAERAKTFRIATAVLLGWLALSIAMAARGVYQVGSTEIPTIQYAILLPIVVGALLIWRSEVVYRIIAAVPQPWLVGVQVYRALGVIFLILYAMDKLPALFAWPAGIGDIAIGLAAPFVAVAYGRAPRNAASLVRTWNGLGILDLVIAVGTGFATSRSLVQPIVVQPSSDMMTVLPMVLIPIYLVPLSIVLHLASLAKLRSEVAAGNGFGRPVAA
jgi:hypothetical protein